MAVGGRLAVRGRMAVGCRMAACGREGGLISLTTYSGVSTLREQIDTYMINYWEIFMLAD